jgi:hypothetical protein
LISAISSALGSQVDIVFMRSGLSSGYRAEISECTESPISESHQNRHVNQVFSNLIGPTAPHRAIKSSAIGPTTGQAVMKIWITASAAKTTPSPEHPSGVFVAAFPKALVGFGEAPHCLGQGPSPHSLFSVIGEGGIRPFLAELCWHDLSPLPSE